MAQPFHRPARPLALLRGAECLVHGEEDAGLVIAKLAALQGQFLGRRGGGAV